MTAVPSSLPPLLRVRDLTKLLGVSRVTIWSWRRAGHFPEPIQLGPNVVAWSEVTIAEWIASRPTVQD